MKVPNFLIVLAWLFAATSIVSAENLRSDSYYVQFGNFNMAAGQRGSASYALSDTMGGLAVGPYGAYGSSGYFIGSGFQYIYQIDDFAFSISKLNIELGELFANSFSSDDHQLTVTTNGASGYSIYAFANSPLTLLADPLVTIPDTTCDASDCDEGTAAPWTNAAQAGFGFNVSGDDVTVDFINGNYFRQFANNALSEPMELIMGSNNVALNSTSTVTYKAAMPAAQQAGNYQTSIVFVAVPAY